MKSRSKLSNTRKLLFSLIVLVVTVVGVEGAFRLTRGPPPPYDAIARISKCRIYTDHDWSRLDCEPEDDGDLALPTTPTAGRPRVVFLGESTVRQTGRRPIPYAFADAVAELLPGIEVYNMGVSGLSAAGVARLSADLAAVEPDLVVIYSGHNDYNNDVFRGAIAGTYLWLTPVYRLLARSWIHGLVARRPRGAGFEGRSRQGVNAVEDDLVFRVRDQVAARFRHDLALAVRESPAPVLLCTLLRNPAWPPTGALVTGQPACSRALQAVMGPGAIARRLEQSERLCGDVSVTAWLRFQVATEQGDVETARAAWYRSLDLDALPLRAPSSADAIIREVAAETGATLVDLEAMWGPGASPAWFSDNLHLSTDGARVVGEVIASAIEAKLAQPTTFSSSTR